MKSYIKIGEKNYFKSIDEYCTIYRTTDINEAYKTNKRDAETIANLLLKCGMVSTTVLNEYPTT